MKEPKIIAIGDNVCDKYLSRGKMYPGGQCVNTCVYAKWNGVNSAYLGKYGNDEVAECVQETLKKLEIDDTHCRHFQGENGFALVTLKETDRVFLGSNKGGIAKDHAFDFNEEDMDYIQQYDLIYTNLNSYIEQDLSKLYQTKVATVYKGNIIKNLIMDCQSYTKYRPNETTGGIFVSWRRKEELPTGA